MHNSMKNRVLWPFYNYSTTKIDYQRKGLEKERITDIIPYIPKNIQDLYWFSP